MYINGCSIRRVLNWPPDVFIFLRTRFLSNHWCWIFYVSVWVITSKQIFINGAKVPNKHYKIIPGYSALQDHPEAIALQRLSSFVRPSITMISLSPSGRQAIIWSNVGILLIRNLRTNFIKITIKIHTFRLLKCIWKWRLENGGHLLSASMC